MVLGCVFTVILEWKVTQRIASSGYTIHALDRLLWLSTLIMLGQHGKGNLAMGLLAISTLNLAIYFLEGFLSAQDIFIFQSRGIDKTEKMWIYLSMAYVTLLTGLTAGLIMLFDLYLFNYLTLKTNVTFKTTLFLWILFPVYFLHGIQKVLSQFLTVKSIMYPVAIANAIALVVNLFGGTMMFYVSIGPIGCAIALLSAKLLAILYLTRFINKNLDNSELLWSFWALVRLLWKQVKTIFGIASATIQQSKRLLSRKKSRTSQSADKPPRRAPLLSRRKNSSSRVLPQSQDPLDQSSTHQQESPMDVENEGVELTTLADTSVPVDDTDAVYARDGDSLLHAKDDLEEVMIGSSFYSLRDLASNAVRYLIVGFPAGILLAVDTWPYELLCLLTAHMGTIAMDTHQMLFLIVQYFTIMGVTPWATATTIRIQTLFKLQQPSSALAVGWNCLLHGLAVSCLFSVTLFALGPYLGYLFSNNEDIAQRSERMIWWPSMFALSYGLQTTLRGIMRAVNYQSDLISLQFVAVWVVGMPVGVYLAFYVRPTYGLDGLWIGMLMGSGLFSAVMFVQFLVINWEHESRRFNYRLSQRESNMRQRSHHAAFESYINDVAFPNVANIALGGFLFRALTEEEEINELEAVELQENINPLLSEQQDPN